MKKLLLCTLFSFTSLLAFSQGLADRFISSLGGTYFLDYSATPVKAEWIDDASSPYWEYRATSSFSVYTFIYTARLNMAEPSDNLAVSASASPSLGVIFSEVGLGGINVPVTVNLDFGAGATYHTTHNAGGTFGLGVEYNKIGLIPTGEYSSEDYKTSWIQPVVIAGFRYWNKRNNLREINLKFGMGSAQDYRESQSEDLTTRRALTARLSFIKFLNY